MVLTRDKCSFANSVSTRLDLNAGKDFNFCYHDNQKWLTTVYNLAITKKHISIPVTSLIKPFRDLSLSQVILKVAK